jgi:tetratricopeptide (TPR) repeat protein
MFAVLWRYRARWGRPWVAGLACYVVLIAPVLGFVTMSYMKLSLVADHFQYPAIAVVLAMVISELWKLASIRTITAWIGGAAAAAIMAVLCILSIQRAWLMRGQIPLWRETIAKNPSAWMAYYLLGTQLAQEGQSLDGAGRPQEALRDYQEAEDWLARGAEIQPNYSELHANLGAVQILTGHVDQGIAQLKKGLEIKPNDAISWNNLGSALEGKGQLELAIECYRRALSVSPEYAVAKQNLERAMAGGSVR